MKKNNIVPFPSSIDAKLSDLLIKHERAIEKYDADIKKLNWFSAGLITGVLGTFFIFIGVYYFVGIY